jgi:hypothetical protein
MQCVLKIRCNLYGILLIARAQALFNVEKSSWLREKSTRAIRTIGYYMVEKYDAAARNAYICAGSISRRAGLGEL